MNHHPRIRDLSTYEGRYVSVTQLAAYCQLTTRTVYHHLEKGALRAVRIGGSLRITIREARRYAGIPTGSDR